TRTTIGRKLRSKQPRIGPSQEKTTDEIPFLSKSYRSLDALFCSHRFGGEGPELGPNAPSCIAASGTASSPSATGTELFGAADLIYGRTANQCGDWTCGRGHSGRRASPRPGSICHSDCDDKCGESGKGRDWPREARVGTGGCKTFPRQSNQRRWD